MTKAEAVIRSADILPDGVDRDELLRYIEELDNKAGNETGSSAQGDTLIIPGPYDMAYVFYAVSCVWFRREEFELYNNYRKRAYGIYMEYMRLHNRGRSHTASKVRNLW